MPKWGSLAMRRLWLKVISPLDFQHHHKDKPAAHASIKEETMKMDEGMDGAASTG